MYREEEGRWREGRVGWGRKGRGTEREENGAEGKKGGKGGRREGKGWQGNGRNGNWGGSLRHGLWGGWTPLSPPNALEEISYMKTGNEISLDVIQCTGINSDGSYKMLIASSISPNS
jgi:hypothetical protein